MVDTPHPVRVPVTFSRPGDGGLHDVFIAGVDDDWDAIRRRWHGTESILVVISGTTVIGEDDAFLTRWFSQSGEIELCGSGAFAAASVFFSRIRPEARQFTQRGRYHDVVAMRSENKIRIRLPRCALTRYNPPTVLLRALALAGYESCWANSTLRVVVVHLSTDVDLGSVLPDFERLRAIADRGIGAVMLTNRDSSQDAFRYRYFAPWSGLDESPVAVSANAVLGPYWHHHLKRRNMIAHQISSSQPSFALEVTGDGTWVEGFSTPPSPPS